MIKVLYFARLREQLQTESEQLEWDPEVMDVGALSAILGRRGGVWSEVFEDSTVMSAVNQEMATGSTLIKDGDEIAYFPPVTGG